MREDARSVIQPDQERVYASASPLTQATEAVGVAIADPGRARALAHAARQCANGDPEPESVVERALGRAAQAEGKLDEAVRRFRAALELAEAGDFAQRAAEARMSLAYVLAEQGDTGSALRETDRAAPALQGLAAAELVAQRATILTRVGRFDEALDGYRRALAAIQGASGAELLEAQVRANRGVLLLYLDQLRAAEHDLLHAEARYLEAGREADTALVRHNLGYIAALRGDVPAALVWYDQVSEQYLAAGRHPDILLMDRAEVLLSVRLVAEARRAAEAAVAEYASRRMAVNLAEARLILAQAALLEGDLEVAQAEAELARQAFHRQQRPAWAALARYIALRVAWDGGQCTKVTLRTGQRTVASLAQTGWALATLDARIIVARIALELGKVTVARRAVARAAQARHRGPADLRARAWHAEALLRLSDGDRRGADAALRAGMRVLDRFQAALGATELRAHVSGHGRELARLGLQLALEGNRPRSVLSWAERWRAGSLRLRPARPPDDAALADDLGALRHVVAEINERIVEGRDTTPLLRRQAALEETVRRRARHASGSWAALADAPPTLELLREALGPKALVEYVDFGGQLHAVVLAGSRVRLHHMGPRDEAETELSALRFALRRLAFSQGTERSLAAARVSASHSAQRLDSLLLGPVRAEVDDRELVVVPTGALHALPWAALPSCASRSVSVAPSAALWHRAATAAGPVSPLSERVLLVAGPGLSHAATEVAALARRYHGAVHLDGHRARVEAVASALDGAGLAHIAAHGQFRADNPLFSSLTLADGPLTVYDLERLERSPSLLVLSACESGLSAVAPGDELMGLASALFALGTRTLVVSVAPVPDAATRALMLAFHRALQQGLAPAAALAHAQARVVSGHHSEVAAAAGFVCFGAG
jgi:tetratricopeptide (TPR) repeat protein